MKGNAAAGEGQPSSPHLPRDAAARRREGRLGGEEQGTARQVPVTWRRKGGKPAKTQVILVAVERAGHRMALHFVTAE